MLTNNDLLLKKLNGFIRKYYRNILLKGLFYSITLLVIFLLFFLLIEFFGYNSIIVRTVIFYLYGVFALVLLVCYIIYPLTKLLNIGKTISHEDAAKIIGKHFPEVADKLLNLLQLKQQSLNSDSQILLASIDQRTKELSPISFHKAIDKKKTKKIGIIAISILFVFLFIAILFPNFLKDSTYRYINHTQYFEKPAPFEFLLQNTELEVLQNEDFLVELKVKGNMLPDMVNIKINGQNFSMKKNNKTAFYYNISQIQKNISLSFSANGYESKTYEIKVKPKPILVNIKAKIIPPAYTKLQPTIVTSLNDIYVPKGSSISWEGFVRDTKEITFIQQNGNIVLVPDKSGKFTYSHIVMNDMVFDIKTSNQFTTYSDTLNVFIKIVEDLYPQIAVVEHKDTIFPDRILFRGQIKDDYGFTSLNFFINHIRGNDTLQKVNAIEVNKNDNAQDFYYSYDLTSLSINRGDKLEYYFEVRDNDAINGGKISRSKIIKNEY